MKKNYCGKAALIGFCMLFAGTAASVQAAQNAGDSSLQLGGNFSHAQGSDVGTLTVEGAWGHFFTKNWEVGVIQSLGYSFIDGADDEWIASTIPFFNYYFLGITENDTFQPFVGAFLGASYNDDDITGTLGPQVGFRSFVNDSTFITVKYRYEWFFDELAINNVEDGSSDGNHVITLGVGFVF